MCREGFSELTFGVILRFSWVSRMTDGCGLIVRVFYLGPCGSDLSCFTSSVLLFFHFVLLTLSLSLLNVLIVKLGDKS
jgi:hypothetical protein